MNLISISDICKTRGKYIKKNKDNDIVYRDEFGARVLLFFDKYTVLYLPHATDD